MRGPLDKFFAWALQGCNRDQMLLIALACLGVCAVALIEILANMVFAFTTNTGLNGPHFALIAIWAISYIGGGSTLNELRRRYPHPRTNRDD